MKNKVLLSIFTLISFISFGFIVNAEEIDLTPGEEKMITYPTDSVDYQTKKHSSFQCKSTSDNTTVLNHTADGGGFGVIYKSSSKTFQDGSVECSYKTVSGEKRVTTYVIKYDFGGVITLHGMQTNAPDANGDLNVVFPSFFNDGVKSYSVTSGANYVNVICPNSAINNHCTIQVADAAYNQGPVTAEVVFTLADGKKFPVEVRINAWGAARAYPGGYVTCKANNSQWKEQFGVFAGNINFWQATTGAEIQLPDCGDGKERIVTAGTPIVFAGWVDTWDGSEFHNLQVTIQAPNKCAEVAGADHFYPAGKTHTVRGDKKARYTACFEYVPMVRVAPGHGELSDKSWKEGVTGIFYKEPSGNSKISLPKANEVSNEAGGMHHELKGWQNEFNRNIIEDPGASVDADGTVYTAIYDYDANGSYNNKSVYINDTVNVSLSTKVVKSCTTETNEYLSVKKETDAAGNPVCVVTGLKLTPGDVVQPVTVEYEDGAKVVYKFTVISDFGFYDQAFEPQIIVDYQEPKSETDKAIIKEEPCQRFDTKDFLTYDEVNGEMIEGSFLANSVYGARCKTEPGADYNVGMCLDPGLPGPHEQEYMFEKTIDVNTRIGAMVKELAKHTNKIVKGAGITGNTYRMGVNTAFRIAFIAHGDTYKGLPDHWKNAGNALKAGKVDEAAGYIFTNGCGSACSVAKTYLNIYVNFNAADIKEQKFEVKKVTQTTLGEDGNSYTITYSGSKLYVPNYVDIREGVYNGNGNGTFSVHLVLKKEAGLTEDGRYIYALENGDDVTKLTVPSIKDLVIPTAVDAKDGTVDKTLSEAQKEAAIKLDITSTGALNIYTIIPVVGERQRLLLFDEEDNEVYIYLDPGDGDHYCNQVPALKVEDCDAKAKGSGGGECNLELFALQCCNLVNEGDYPELFHNYCTNSCSNNTVAQVCEYVPFSEAKDKGQTATMYEIREGVKYDSGTKAFELDLGSCVVNINEYKPGSGMEKAFEKVDDVGNSRVLKEFAGNKYCRVTCKEDWNISMGSFGSYMGKDAVSAGTYFEIKEADIFIRGDQSCYTSKMNLTTYHEDQKALAKQMPAQYNDYSKAAHKLRDLLYEGKTTNAEGNSVNHKNTKTYDTAKGGTGTACKGYNDVQLYHYETGTCSTPGCTPPQVRVDDEKVRLCSTLTEYNGSAEGATNNEVDLSYISWFKLSREYVDKDNFKGAYQTYKATDDGANFAKDAKVDYNNMQAKIECQGYDDGDDDADTIQCTLSVDGSESVATETFDWTDISATDTNLNTKINDRIVKVNTNDALNDSGHDSEVLKEYITQNQKDLQTKMNAAKAKITELESQLKGNSNNWFDCQNFLLYTSAYNGRDVSKDGDDVANAKSAYNLNGSFTALGNTREPVKVEVSFDPSVSYTYDELIYMNLIDNKGASPYGRNGLHDNILVPHDKKNGTVTLGSGENKPIKLLEGDSTVDVNYSVKEGKSYSSVDSKKYEGSGAGHSLQSGRSIVLCKVGEKGSNNVQGQTSVYSPFASSDINGWIDGNCYKIGLYYYEGTAYTKESISNSSFYKNKGAWNSYVNGVIAHGGDEPDHKDQVKDAIEKYKAVTKVEFPTDNNSLRKWNQLGTINVFPISMTTARNLYTYTYSFNNIGVYFAKDAMDATRYARLMGTVDSVFKYNTRTCFYEVKEDICRCCGDPMDYHYTTTRKTDTEIVERFIKKNDSKNHDLSGATSDADKIKTNTSGSMGLFNTVTSLNSLFNNVSDDSGNKRETPANWSENGIYMYDGFSRYVTNKGEVAAKAIEYMGEEIYSANSSAEYAYRLTPEAIAEIKADNASSSYGTNYENLQVYGAVQMAPISNTALDKGAAWNMNGTSKPDGEKVYQNIGFQHYGSKFLEDVASKYTKFTDDKGFTNYDLASRQADGDSTVCAVLETDLGNGKNGQTNFNAINKKIRDEKCRWVDYIEKDGHKADGSKAEGAESDGPFRLAFK